ncbi:MAG: helix-turn-helix domain-containing protein [Bacteroidales bacterium]|jgi:transcriptional regulator with XRE-family HTH domain|nr:helix-turn-helix domain-containing protein [Bacteroidales bacterium]
MTNKEKILELVSKEKTNSVERNRSRIKNRAGIRESQSIALKVLVRLKEKGWKQTDLAKALNVTPQQITKIVSGKENLTIDTQIKLQEVLDIPILASYYESKMKQSELIEVKVPGIKTTYKAISTLEDTNIIETAKTVINPSLFVVYNNDSLEVVL